jgi:hypothetical protein
MPPAALTVLDLFQVVAVGPHRTTMDPSFPRYDFLSLLFRHFFAALLTSYARSWTVTVGTGWFVYKLTLATLCLASCSLVVSSPIATLCVFVPPCTLSSFSRDSCPLHRTAVRTSRLRSLRCAATRVPFSFPPSRLVLPSVLLASRPAPAPASPLLRRAAEHILPLDNPFPFHPSILSH